MEHIDPEELDALALGDAQPTPPQTAHLDACAACRAEIASVRRTAGAVRSARDLGVAEAPDSVWAAIHAELGLDASLSATPRRGVFTEPERASEAAVSGAGADPVPAVDAPMANRPMADTPVANAPARREDAGAAPASPVTRRSRAAAGPTRSRRPGARRRWLIPAIAAGVALVLGLGGGLGLSRVLQPTTGDVVATARLAALPDWPDASGTATLRELPDGTRQVDVEVDSAEDAVGSPLREVWLLSPDASGLVSIGFLDGTTGTFTVPTDVDLGAYPIVDVSAEPQDGDPAHSGDSIVRGELDAS